MKKIKTILIEDDPIILDWMKSNLESEFSKLDICGSASNVTEAVEKIEKYEPNLLISDIELGSGTAFQILEQVVFKNFHTIFTTSFEGFAVEAFKVKAYDYLTKPVTLEALHDSINDFYEFWNNQAQFEKSQSLLTNNQGRRRISFHHRGLIELIDVEDIIYLQASENYCKVFITDKRPIVLSKPLKFYANKLEDEDHFIRIHQSFLINFNHVKNVIMTKLPQVEMINGKALSISRSKKQEFLNRLG